MSQWKCQRSGNHGLAAPEAEDKVEGALLLDVVVGKSTAVLELLASKDQALLVRRDALLVLDLGLDGLDGVAALDLESDVLAGEGLNKNLHLCYSSNAT